MSKYFENHYGNIEEFNYPTTRKQAIENLDDFIVNKFKSFGDYEDSVDQRSYLWFHSNLSSALNLGLIEIAYHEVNKKICFFGRAY